VISNNTSNIYENQSFEETRFFPQKAKSEAPQSGNAASQSCAAASQQLQSSARRPQADQKPKAREI